MRRAVPLLGVLALAGCGGGKSVAPLPEKVVGTVPTSAPTTTQAATTTAGGGGGGTSGKALFASKGCNACHTYKPAGPTAVGKIGPDLDKLAQYAKQANQPLDKFTR